MDEEYNDKNIEKNFDLDLIRFWRLAKGNSVSRWLLSTRELLSATNLLDINIKKLSDNYPVLFDDKSNYPKSLFAIGPNRMLKGMAVEAVFKALWLDKGNKILVGEEKNGNKKLVYKKIPSVNDHDLLSYLNILDLSFNVEEKNYLIILSDHIVADGRYPIHKKEKETTLSSNYIKDEYNYLKNIFVKILNKFKRDDLEVISEIDKIIKLL